jgi:hypothetical protein
MTVIDRPIDRLLAAIARAEVGELDVFAEQVQMDATVPHWRYSVCGADAVRAELSRWYADAGHFEELRRTPLPTGELVEFTLCWEEKGVPHAAHQVHVIEVDESGHVISDHIWCGGRWPAALLAEMAEEAAVSA